MLPGIGNLNSQRANPGQRRYGKRKDSAIRTLVAETLVLAKTHGYVEKIENELEEELQQDIDPPKENLGRWRRKGYQFFKSKYMLLTVVVLCITDCALVLGELTLDLHKVKVTLEENEKLTESTTTFLKNMRSQHQHYLIGKQFPEVFDMLMAASIQWNISEYNLAHTEEENLNVNNITNRYRRTLTKTTEHAAQTSDNHFIVDDAAVNEHHHSKGQSIQEDIAHAFHFASISILGIILLETILKALCAGCIFFHRRLEVFDAFIVITSFIVDTCLMVYLPMYDTRDFVFILAFLLPWRVIRVVNSLVVAVKDHEHFRLKLVYSRKKKIQHNLREAEVRMQIFKYQCNALKRLCLAEGLDEWKIDHCLKAEQKYQPTIGKKKCKVKIDSSTLSLITELDEGCSSTRSSPRHSLPSLDFPGLRFLNGHSKHNETNGSIEENGNDLDQQHQNA
ncbi:uncharacterized protein LOC110450124 isoform X2 [Mizuhopecten yessoensis]|uniref:uncharacterized protein LOC110450124 isoform X2 n=1 Tax=Mizuhopecten yessoensis TaxID=6573 RepID=UPI000B45D1D4|nr:uncharacterized protein LOC110450124 isoform X2 [Mizuhopecten yessoensis]